MKFKALFLVLIFIVVSCNKDEGEPDEPCTSTPILITNQVSEITDVSVKLSGTFEAPTCDPTITSQGFVYGKTTPPKISDNVVKANGSEVSLNLTGLEPNTKYYVKAFLVNPLGIPAFYGNEVSFTTSIGEIGLSVKEITNITAVSADASSHITSDGGADITARGICWSTSQNPTVNDYKTSNGSGIGEFQSEMINLEKEKTYYVRVYATNKEGTIYSNEVSFTTMDGVPSLTTNGISGITLNSAMSGGNITNDGGAEITTRGVCWSTAQNPTISDTKTTDGSGIGEFTSQLTTLEMNTTYYVRAYATNEYGTTTYGSEKVFETAIGETTITTNEITDITINTATSGGNITADGGADITARGVCWATTSNPTISDTKTTDGSGIGEFTSQLTTLEMNTTYYARAYATNEYGTTTYGSEKVFETASVSQPILVAPLNNATDVAATSNLQWQASEWSNTQITTPIHYDIYFGTSTTPTKVGTVTDGALTYALPTAEYNTLYYWQVKAVDEQGATLAESEIWSFTTTPSGGVYNGDVTFNTQQEVDDFGANNYTEITGALMIRGNITSLSALSSITSVGGGLAIIGVDALTSLTGLENITLFSDGRGITISDNTSLTSLSALSSITSVGGSLIIDNNDALTSLTGLHNITSVSTHLFIINNGALTSLSALSRITSVNLRTSISNNDALTSLTGLENITLFSDGSGIRIDDNDALTSLSALSRITSVRGSLNIDNNDALTSLTGLENITSISYDLTIQGNTVLINLCGIKPLIDANGLKGSYSVSDNAYNPTIINIGNGNCSQ